METTSITYLPTSLHYIKCSDLLLQIAHVIGKGSFTNHVASHGGRGGLPNDHFIL